MATAALTGTAAAGLAESQVRSGAQTLIATLTGDTFLPASAGLKTIVYVGGQVGGRAGAASTQSVTFALTGGTHSTPQAGDLVFVQVAVGSVGRTPTTAVVTPTGYTAYGQLNADGTTNDTSANVSRKVMGGTPDTTFTLPSTGNVNDAQSYTVHVFRNVDPTTPDDVAATTATGTATGRPDPPSTTPVTAGAVVLIFGAGATGTGATYVAPANFTTNFLTRTDPDTTDSMVGSGYWTGWTSGAVNPAGYTGGTTNAADSWVARTIVLRPAATPAFADIRANIRDGLTSAQAEAAGWNAKVRPNIPLANIVRTSNTVCTITLQAQADYDITTQETITWTLPAAAVAGDVPIVAAPTVPIWGGTLRVQQRPGKIALYPASSITFTLPVAPAIGNAIVIAVNHWRESGSPSFPTTLTDSQGNSYTRTTPSLVPGYPAFETALYYCPRVLATGAPLTITVTGGPGDVFVGCVLEVAGLAGPALHLTFEGATSNTTGTTATTALADAVVDSLVVATYLSAGYPDTITVQTDSPSWVEELEEVSGDILPSEVDTVIDPRTGFRQLDAQWVLSVAVPWTATIVTFDSPVPDARTAVLTQTLGACTVSSDGTVVAPAAPTGFPSIVPGVGDAILDDFNRAGPGLGATWTTGILAFGGSAMQIRASTLLDGCALGNYGAGYYNAKTFGQDVELYLDLPASGGTALSAGVLPQLFFRLTAGAANGYFLMLRYNNAGSCEWQFSISPNTQIGPLVDRPVVAGDKFGVRAHGSLLEAYHYTAGAWNQTPVISLVDTGYVAPGMVGVGMYGAGALPTADNFVAGSEVTGSPGRSAALTQTCANATLSSAGTVVALPSRTADLAQTLATCTVAATATTASTAALTQTLAACTLASTGTVVTLPTRTGVLTQTVGPATLLASGSVGALPGRDAALAQTLPATTLTAEAAVGPKPTRDGALALTLPDTTLASTGTVVALPTRAGALTHTLAGCTVASTGTVVLPTRTGVLTQALAACALLASGSVGSVPGRDAALSQTLQSCTVAATGTVVALPARTAAVTQTLAGCTLTTSGTVVDPPTRTATLALTLADTTLTATGFLGSRAMTVEPTTLPDPKSDVPYAQQLTVDGGGGPPVTFVLLDGFLPPGLTLSTEGLISGTPPSGATLMPATWPAGVVDTPYTQPLTIVETGIGVSYTFTVQATDGLGVTAGHTYTLTLQSGWLAATLWGVVPPSKLPSCLSCGGWTGLVTGLPMTVGTWAVTMRATNPAGTALTRTYTLTVTS